MLYQSVQQALRVTTATRRSRKGEISSCNAFAPGCAGKLAIEAMDRAMLGDDARGQISEAATPWTRSDHIDKFRILSGGILTMPGAARFLEVVLCNIGEHGHDLHYRGYDIIDIETDDDSIGGHFLHLLHGERPRQSWVQAMHASLVLYAEHEFNASTFTARVVAGTGSDLYPAIAGGIGALRGSKHGAPTRWRSRSSSVTSRPTRRRRTYAPGSNAKSW